MCIGCYEKFGSPRIVNDKTIAAAELVSSVYEKASTGGKGHIVFDDWNLNDDDVKWSLDNLNELDGEYELGKDQLELEKKCLEVFLELTVQERASALAISENFFQLTESKEAKLYEAEIKRRWSK